MTNPLFPKPDDAAEPNGEIIVILTAGGTFLCDAQDEVKEPRYFETLEEFIKGCNLVEGFRQRGLYQRADGKWFLADGAEIVYRPINPPIDSTNATSNRHRLKILKEIHQAKEEFGENTSVQVIFGTDTAAELLAAVNLYNGMGETSIAITASQEPANQMGSDGPQNFWTGFEMLWGKILKEAVIVTNNGKEVLCANTRKDSDSGPKIFVAKAINRVAVAIRDGIKLTPFGVARAKFAATKRNLGALPFLPDEADYDGLLITYYNPAAPGNQEEQAEDITYNLLRSKRKRPSIAINLRLKGSNNLPGYIRLVLQIANHLRIALFATSDVLGAHTTNRDGKLYAVAADIMAEKLKLGNYIPLPATLIGPDMRAEFILVYAKRYAEPRTAEFLLLCHLFASFSWNFEDIDYKNPGIKCDREDLITTLSTLEKTRLDLQARHPGIDKAELARKILANENVRAILAGYIPHIASSEGEYALTGKNQLIVNYASSAQDSLPPGGGGEPVRRRASGCARFEIPRSSGGIRRSANNPGTREVIKAAP